MKMLFITLLVLLCKGLCAQNKITSGNPVIKGWYADPEAIIINSEYWIYPTWSDVYEKQVFFDAFSSPDLVSGTYEVYLGGSSTGSLVDSLYSGGQYSPGSRYTSFTASGIVTTVR